MHNGASTWLVDIGNGSPFTTALYVRDVSGLTVAPEIPPLEPRLDRVPGADIDPADWTGWWAAIVATGPVPGRPRVAPTAGAALLNRYGRVADWVGDWEDRETRAVTVTGVSEVVSALEAAAGRPATFAYAVDVVPVAGPFHLDLTPTWLLIGTETAQRGGLGDLLAARLAPLV